LNKSEKSIKRGKVEGEYQQLLASEPTAPVSFLLYFDAGGISLTKTSLNLIPEILKSVKERTPSEISIIGHTDSKGAADYNSRLALERANEVASIITKIDTQLKNIDIRSHGENDQLVITDDNVSEEKNRRVEIMIR
jgi:outer membrane protein OmpA-like peptidoglycan-associated protein